MEKSVCRKHLASRHGSSSRYSLPSSLDCLCGSRRRNSDRAMPRQASILFPSKRKICSVAATSLPRRSQATGRWPDSSLKKYSFLFVGRQHRLLAFSARGRTLRQTQDRRGHVIRHGKPTAHRKRNACFRGASWRRSSLCVSSTPARVARILG